MSTVGRCSSCVPMPPSTSRGSISSWMEGGISFSLPTKDLLDLSVLARHVAGTETVAIEAIAHRYVKALQAGGVLYFAGNGGSAADAQHIAAEYMVRFMGDRDPYRAIALTTDTSFITACGNDLDFDHIFARQIDALGRPDDVLTLHSTSGESENVLNACDIAQTKGITVVALTGKGGGRLAQMADYSLTIPSDNTARIQELHLAIQHSICGLVELLLTS